MKKLVMSMMTMAALFSSCSNDELSVLSEGNAIQFDGFVNKSTRSNDVTNESLKNFSVYGFMESVDGQIFDRETVRKEDTGWMYDNTQYWIPGKSYYFSAIAPAYGAQWDYEVGRSVKGGTITFSNGNGTQDLVYAYTGGITSDAATVGFTFSHLLSRIVFSFTNGFENSSTTLNVKDIKITNAVDKANKDMEVFTSRWNEETTNVLSFGDSRNSRIPVLEDGISDIKYMIPVNKTYELTFTVEMYVGKTLAGTYEHQAQINNLFQSNMSYNLNAVIDATNIDPKGALEQIHFNVSGIEDWHDHLEDAQ